MPDYTYHGDDGRYYGGTLNRLVTDGDVVTADANPDPNRFDEAAAGVEINAAAGVEINAAAPATDNPPQEG